MKYDNCKDCYSKCEHAGKNREFVCINDISCKKSKQTNADRIKAMTDEELARFLVDFPLVSIYEDCIHVKDGVDCEQCVLEWLQLEVEEGE